MVQLVMDLPLLRVKPMKDTSQCMNPRFPLSGAREFPEYISSERKLSEKFQIHSNRTKIPSISPIRKIRCEE